MLGKTIMVQGTASSVGKSVLVTALCRIFRQDGLRVAPFKAQNMSLNAAVTPDGLEMARAQAVQAEAAGAEPRVDMNPILLKPEADDRAQVVVLGRPAMTLPAAEYYSRKSDLWAVVTEALDRLRGSYELVVIEGAGSPAEVNLRDRDIANMRVARYAGSPVLLVGDIDRGGVFAALVGTMELLQPEERWLVKGLVVNKFRGDAAVLSPGLTFLAERTGVPVVGVVPYIPGLRIATEDSASLEEPATHRGPLDIAVLRLPRISNFDEFRLLGAEPAVTLRFVDGPDTLGRPDLVVLPGSKTTVADLEFLHQTGLAEVVRRLAREGAPLLGICGGYQMLGEWIADPWRVESERDWAPGLGLLPAHTIFQREKRTRRVLARAIAPFGFVKLLDGAAVEGYEIHMGLTTGEGPALFQVASQGEPWRAEGCVASGGLVAGTSVHGIFEDHRARHALIRWLGERRGVQLGAAAIPDREAEYDRLAEAVRASLDLGAIYRAIGIDPAA